MRYGTYRYRTYSEIFENVNDFIEQYNMSAFPKVLDVSSNKLGADISTIYYMLFARYGQSPIASCSEEQFVSRLFLTIFQYAPTWKRKLELQDDLRNLTEEDLLKGGKAFYNHANNPSTAPVNDSTEALDKIDSQNVTSYLKSKMEGYSILASLLEIDVTKEFLDQFSILFNPLVMPDYELHYCEEDE